VPQITVGLHNFVHNGMEVTNDRQEDHHLGSVV